MLGYVMLASQFLRALVYADHKHREHVATESMLAPHRMAEELRSLLDQRKWTEFETAEARAWEAVDHLQPQDAGLAAVQLSLVRCEYGMLRQDPAVAREGVELVRSNGANLPPAEAREFELQALAVAALTLREDEQDEACLAFAEQVLAPGDRARHARTTGLMVIAASHVALVRRALGQHDAADLAARRAVEWSERPDLQEAPADAAHAAFDAALHRLGELDVASAAEWFDRAEQVVAASEHPVCRLQHAGALLARQTLLPGDPLLGGPERRRRNELVLSRLKGIQTAQARLFKARACANLGRVCREEGRHADAVGHLVDALARLAAPLDHEAMRLRVELLVECGRARAAAEDPLALQDLERALEEASTAVDPGARAHVVEILLELGPMLSALGMHAHLADLLHGAGDVVASLPAEKAAVATAELEMLNADAESSRGRGAEARRRLATLLARLENEPVEGTGKLRFFVLTRLAFNAFAVQEFAPAIEWFERALATVPSLPDSLEAERSELEWALASSKLQLGLIDEARDVYRRAFERGRSSGDPHGRFTAAKSACALGEYALTPRERAEWLRSALVLARSCRLPAADRMAESIDARLRDVERGA